MLFRRSNRAAAVAGSFYPSDSAELRKMTENMLSDCADHTLVVPKIIIAPHAGYIYSGTAAAAAYSILRRSGNLIKRVVIIGPSHHMAFKGLAVPSSKTFSTPLGKIGIDSTALELIAQYTTTLDRAHSAEHSIETQLPFLQCMLKEFAIVPILFGDVSYEGISDVIETLWGSSETLIVISTDLSHYHTYEKAKITDQKTSELILSGQYKLLNSSMACGACGVCGALYTASKLALSCTEIMRLTSGDTKIGDKQRVVGYGAYHLGNLERCGVPYNNNYKKFLLELARKSITYGAQHGSRMDISGVERSIKIPQATFVTLEDKAGNLRGCIGTLEPRYDAVQDVIRNAHSAAFEDSRFTPIKLNEIDDILISISILTPAQSMNFASEEDLLEQIEPNIDGLILSDGNKRGTFLPAVWQDISDKKEFLSRLKVKAGLCENYWSDTIKCSRYHAIYFSDSDFGQH